MTTKSHKIKLMPRILSAILAPLYLGLSLYAISCALHCESSPEVRQSYHHSSGHHHDHENEDQGTSSKAPVSGDIHLCKISQRSVGQTIASQQTNPVRIDVETYEVFEKSPIVLSAFDGGENLSRAPPAV